jgi:hypothetical protein
MNKPLFGIPLRLFQLWLYAPLLILVYVDYQTLSTFNKVGLMHTVVALGASLFIAGIVIFSKEFRQFNRVTPFRILVFFGIVFGVTELFIIVLTSIGEYFRFTTALVTYPGIIGLILTPLMVMRLEVLLPNSDQSLDRVNKS